MPTKKASVQVEPKQKAVMTSMSQNSYSLSSMLQFVNNNFLLLVVGSGLFIFGFVFGSLWKENQTLKAGGGLGNQPAAQAPAAAPAAAQPLSDADWKEIQKEPVFVIGDKNAKVTMVEFTDYQCPFCEQFYTQTQKQLIEDYVKTGKMKIILKDQPLPFHPNSNSSAQLVRCAVEQGKGLQMHDQLFTNQAMWVSLTGEDLYKKYSELANAGGLNGDKAVACVKEGKYKTATDNDSALGNKVGAGGTPTFFVEKDPLVGAQPIAAFKAKIDEKLAK
ncbi:MAG: DsbA family protein [Patescibacteria group bacterium]